MEKYAYLSWSNQCDIEPVMYQTGFEQRAYLDTELMKPRYETVEEGFEKDNGEFVQTIVKHKKIYTCKFLVDEPMADAFSLLKMHDNVRFESNYLESSPIKDLLFSVDWISDSVGEGMLEFTVETIVKAGCCNNMDILDCYAAGKPGNFINLVLYSDGKWTDPQNNGIVHGNRYMFYAENQYFPGLYVGWVYQFDNTKIGINQSSNTVGWVNDCASDLVALGLPYSGEHINDWYKGKCYANEANSNELIYFTGDYNDSFHRLGEILSETVVAGTSINVKGFAAPNLFVRLKYRERNIYTDWFLPSSAELLLMANNLHDQGKGGFTNGAIYFSSTEVSATQVLRGVFSTPTSSLLNGNKSTVTVRSRFCRTFFSTTQYANGTAMQGGYVFHSVAGGGGYTHYVAAHESTEVVAVWGAVGTVTGVTATAVGTGATNTAALLPILSGLGETGKAAQLADALIYPATSSGLYTTLASLTAEDFKELGFTWNPYTLTPQEFEWEIEVYNHNCDDYELHTRNTGDTV